MQILNYTSAKQIRQQLILTLLFCLSIGIQQTDAQKLKKVSVEDLNMEAHPIEAKADAAFLHSENKVHISYNVDKERWESNQEVVHRIKFYTQAGIDRYADWTLSYYVENNRTREQIKKIEATVYSVENGKVKKQKMSKKDIYDSEDSKYYSSKKFALPNLKPGSIAEIKYRILSPDVRSTPKWYFQYDIPVDYSAYEITIPEYFIFNAATSGAFPLAIEENTKNENIKFTRSVDASNNELLVKRQKVTDQLDFISNITKYVAEQVPSMTAEKYVTNINNYRSSIMMELMATKFPGSTYNSIARSWDDVADELNGYDSFGKRLKESSKEIKAFADQAETSEDQIAMAVSLYNLVQSNISWNGSYGLTAENKLSKVVKNKTGSSAEMNLLYMNLLRSKGIDAYPIVGKTRSRGFVNAVYPVITDLNHVICGVYINEKLTIVDLSDKLVPFGQLPKESLNLYGILLNESAGERISISNPNKSVQKIMGKYTMSENNIKGDYVSSLSGYAVTELKHKQLNKSASNSDAKANESALNIVVNNVEETAKGMKFECSMETNEFVEQLDDQLLLYPLMSYALEDSPFVLESRDYPIFLDSKANFVYHLTYEIPENYEVSYVPEKLSIGLPEKLASYNYTVTQKDNKLTVLKQYKLNAEYISPTYYEALKTFYDQIIEKEGDAIALKKKI